jgi:hypothetical protein
VPDEATPAEEAAAQAIVAEATALILAAARALLAEDTQLVEHLVSRILDEVTGWIAVHTAVAHIAAAHRELADAVGVDADEALTLALAEVQALRPPPEQAAP